MNCAAWLTGGQPGWPELLLVLLAVMLLFGAKRLPELSRSLGRSIREFKKGREEGAAKEPAADDDDAPPAKPD